MSQVLAATPLIIPVLIADSNRMQSRLLASALHRRPEFVVSSCTVDADSILKAMALSRARVVLLSLNPTVVVSLQLEAIRQVHLAHPQVAKVLMTETYDRELVIGSFRAGVRGIFCLANTHFRLLCRCIQRVADGQVWANTEQMNFLLDIVSEVPSMSVINSTGGQMLTPRECQVVALVAEGFSNRDAARELKLSEHTVKKYLFRIFDKLGISSRVELVVYAVHHGDPRHAEWFARMKQPMPRA